MFTVDLHVHTRPFHWPRGRPTWYDPFGAKTIAAIGGNRGLDGAALTNHDYRVSYENDDPVFVPGIEVTTSQGHVLVVGPDPPKQTPSPAPDPVDVVEDAHDRGCAAILAHPFRDSGVTKYDAAFDAVEVNGKQPGRKARVDELARDLGLPVVGGSDAHLPFELGRVHTVVHADELTPRSVADAIRDGRVEPDRRRYLSDGFFLPAYDAIHKIRGHVDPRTA